MGLLRISTCAYLGWAMSELRGHTALQSFTIGQELVDRCVESLGKALQHSRARHVLVGLVSPQRVSTDADARRQFDLREARTHAART